MSDTKRLKHPAVYGVTTGPGDGSMSNVRAIRRSRSCSQISQIEVIGDPRWQGAVESRMGHPGFLYSDRVVRLFPRSFCRIGQSGFLFTLVRAGTARE